MNTANILYNVFIFFFDLFGCFNYYLYLCTCKSNKYIKTV